MKSGSRSSPSPPAQTNRPDYTVETGVNCYPAHGGAGLEWLVSEHGPGRPVQRPSTGCNGESLTLVWSVEWLAVHP